MTYQRNFDYIWYNLIIPASNIIKPVFNWVVSVCKKKNVKIDKDSKNDFIKSEHFLKVEDFLDACAKGDIDKIKKMKSIDLNNGTKCINLNNGLTEAVRAGQTTTVVYLIKVGASNLDENLKFACINNNYSMVETLIQNGAKIVIGLRFAKSANIIKMLHRYEQNSENID